MLLKPLDIHYDFVSRTASKNIKLTYNNLTDKTLNNYQIIVNCTPLGTFPNVEAYPSIPYHALNSQHLLYDLIYNPQETTFLKFGRQYGTQTVNGLKMLELQAEKAWKLWNK